MGVTGAIEVLEGSGNGVRQIKGNGIFELQGGSIMVEPNAVLQIDATQDLNQNGSETINVNLANGQIDGKVLFTNALITLGQSAGLTGDAELEMRGMNHIVSGDLGSSYQITLMGTEETHSILTLDQSMASSGLIVFDSQHEDNGTQIDIGFNTLTHEGMIDVKNAGEFREITGTGLVQFNAGSTTDVEVDTHLLIVGKQNLNIDGAEIINVALNGGSINGPGAVRFMHSNVTIDPGFTDQATLEMVGFNNFLTGNLIAGQQLTLLGQSGDISGTAAVLLQADMTSAGTIVLDSVDPAGSTNAVMDIGERNFINAPGGVIEAKPGTGGTREIIVATGDMVTPGELINNGQVIGLTRTQRSLLIAAATTGGGSYSGNIEFSNGLALDTGAEVSLSLGGLGELMNHDKIDVTGDVTLEEGTQLNISVDDDLIPNYRPDYGDTIEVLEYTGDRTGVFDTITGLVLASDLALIPEYDDTAGTIMLTAWLPGDANRDMVVDLDDLTLLALNWNQTGKDWSSSDFTGDRKVDLDDLTLLAANWNESFMLNNALMSSFSLPSPSLAVAADVPEPATVFLFSSGLVFLLSRRRNSWQNN